MIILNWQQDLALNTHQHRIKFAQTERGALYGMKGITYQWFIDFIIWTVVITVFILFSDTTITCTRYQVSNPTKKKKLITHYKNGKKDNLTFGKCGGRTGVLGFPPGESWQGISLSLIHTQFWCTSSLFRGAASGLICIKKHMVVYNLLNEWHDLSPLTTRYLSMACTRARGSIFTGPPFHCLTLVQSGCLCSWHLSWCVLKNFSAWEPLKT